MLRQTTMTECKLTRSSVDSAVTRPGSAPVRRGVEARWLPRAAAASRRPGDTVRPRSAARSSLAPKRLDSKFKLYALYDIPLSLLSRFASDSLRRRLRRITPHIIVPFVIACPSCFPAPRYRLRRVYDIHIVLRRCTIVDNQDEEPERNQTRENGEWSDWSTRTNPCPPGMVGTDREFESGFGRACLREGRKGRGNGGGGDDRDGRSRTGKETRRDAGGGKE